MYASVCMPIFACLLVGSSNFLFQKTYLLTSYQHKQHFEEMFAILYPEGTDEERQEMFDLKHNPSLFNAMGGHVGEIGHSTAKAVGGNCMHW